MAVTSNFKEWTVVQEMTLPMFWVALFCSFGGMSFGIDHGYWSGMLGLPRFKEDFGVWDEQLGEYTIPSSWQSAGSGSPIAGLAFGAIASGFIGNRLGRVKVLKISTVICLVGIAIQAAAITSYWQIAVGRIVTALALGLLANTVPMFLAEMAPLKIRGTMVNCYQFSIGVGAVLINTATWGMHTRTDQWAYRLTIILQAVIPIFFLVACFFLPESPRWLLSKGRSEEARRVLTALRTGSGVSVEDVEFELQLIAAAEDDNKAQFGSSWRDCFRGTNLRRTLIVIGVQCLQQAQGSSFIATYIVVFFQAIGVQNVYEIMILFLLTMPVGSACAFYVPDRFGRRWVMIICAAVMATCMFIVAGITGFGLKDNQIAMKGVLAALFLWQFAINIGWSSCVWIVTAETPTLQLREKTITLGTFFGFSVSILVTFINPFMQNAEEGGLEGKVGFVYGGFSVFALVWALFFLPETGRRSLEELDELFREKVSVWRFSKYETVGYGSQVAKIENHVKDVESEKFASARVEIMDGQRQA